MTLRHKLSSGKVVNVIHAEIHGMFDGKRILLDWRGGSKQKLESTIHELLHAECPRWSEKKVQEVATSVADLLWKMGYRQVARHPSRS